MSDLLSIGASGLKAYGGALGTIAENVANAQTPGYARRTLQLGEVPSGGGMMFYRGTVSAAGVQINGVSRSVDVWLIEDARMSSADAGRAGTRLDWMERVEAALSDENNGIATGLTNIFTSADLLSADPNNSTLRRQFLNSVDEVASGFRVAAGQLDRLSGGVEAAAQAETQQLNADLAALSDINTGLRKARAGTTNQANLLDQRDRLLDQIAARGAINTSFDDRGTATVRAADSGDLLVGSNYVAHISAATGANGQISYSIDGAAPFSTAAGTLAGFSEASGHIAQQRSDLDAKAMQFAGQLNAAHQAGTDKDGNAGLALLQGSSAATLMAAPLTIAQVAAADAGSANGNILALGSLRGVADPESVWTSHLTAQAQMTSAARAQNSAASTRSEGATAARHAVSEIDLDREAADLLRFQQAYSASARTIQVAREVMQTLLNAL